MAELALSPRPLLSCLAPLLPVPCQGGSRPRRHLSMLARAGPHQGLVGRCKGLPSTFGMGGSGFRLLGGNIWIQFLLHVQLARLDRSCCTA